MGNERPCLGYNEICSEEQGNEKARADCIRQTAPGVFIMHNMKGPRAPATRDFF